MSHSLLPLTPHSHRNSGSNIVMTHCFPCFRAISQRLTGATRSQLLQRIASVFHSGKDANMYTGSSRTSG
ncbi:hypothetical protein M2418_004981 [Rhizobium sp. BIGb0125]|nr:hypothetical protein [Rhizobium sp. BIGb0125]